MAEKNNVEFIKTNFSRVDKTAVTGPERHRTFQSLTVLFTTFGSVVGTIYSNGFRGGIIGGLIGLVMGIVLMKLFMGDIRHIRRRNTTERTLDSLVAILGSGVFAGTVGGLYGYYIALDFQMALLLVISCTISGAISTMLGGLIALLLEFLVQRKG